MKTRPTGVVKIPRILVYITKALAFFSKRKSAEFALYFFSKPFKFKRPKREDHVFDIAHKELVYIHSIKKKVCVYKWLTNVSVKSKKSALLIHGWNGRGTQLFSITQMLLSEGYNVCAFDAPGHGESPKSKALLTDFIKVAYQLQDIEGGFDLVIGHSLGTVVAMNALTRGVNSNKAVILAPANIVKDVFMDFASKFELSKCLSNSIINLYEEKYDVVTSEYDVNIQAQKLEIPVLVIHDVNDLELHYSNAQEIYKSLVNGKLLLTKGLGHNKLLGDGKVVHEIKNFINS